MDETLLAKYDELKNDISSMGNVAVHVRFHPVVQPGNDEAEAGALIKVGAEPGGRNHRPPRSAPFQWNRSPGIRS